jgi:NTP pyrophosphatase (non-canonical NTP hydrolase)
LDTKKGYNTRGDKHMVKGIEETYTEFTRRTAKYPKRREKEYLMLGLMNEAGEVGGAFKKEIRDRVDNTELIIDEMGDVLWYLTRLCDVYDIKISELMVNNIDKLFNRMTPEQQQVYRDECGY